MSNEITNRWYDHKAENDTGYCPLPGWIISYSSYFRHIGCTPVRDSGGFVTDWKKNFKDRFSEAGLNDQEFKLLVHITRFHYDTASGQASPSVNRLVLEMNKSERSIKRTINSLVEKGALDVINQFNEKGEQISSIYDFFGLIQQCWFWHLIEEKFGRDYMLKALRDGRDSHNVIEQAEETLSRLAEQVYKRRMKNVRVSEGEAKEEAADKSAIVSNIKARFQKEIADSKPASTDKKARTDNQQRAIDWARELMKATGTDTSEMSDDYIAEQHGQQLKNAKIIRDKLQALMPGNAPGLSYRVLRYATDYLNINIAGEEAHGEGGLIRNAGRYISEILDENGNIKDNVPEEIFVSSDKIIKIS